MSYVSDYSASIVYGWNNYTSLDPGLTDVLYNSGLLTASGSNVAFPVLYSYGGSWATVNLNLSPAAQHVYLSASAPTIGDSEPGFIYPNDQTGFAHAYVDYSVNDYATTPSGGGPISVLVSYNAHVVTTGGDGLDPQFDWSVYASAYNSNGTYTSFGSMGGGLLSNLSGSLQFTVMPGSTLWLSEGLVASAGSIASTKGSWPTATGLTPVLDASHTGVLHVQELDANGNPVAGNPDLAFVSGVNYAAVPSSVPEPSIFVLMLLALPILWFARRHRHLLSIGREFPLWFRATRPASGSGVGKPKMNLLDACEHGGRQRYARR